MHPHRSSALDGAAATLTVACTRGVAVPLSWSWSHHPQGRAWAAASARGDTFDRTPYRTIRVIFISYLIVQYFTYRLRVKARRTRTLTACT